MISKTFKKININNKEYDFVDISNISNIDKLPYTYRILIENIVRQKLLGRNDNAEIQVQSILEKRLGEAINFAPNRILSHDILKIYLG